MDSNAKHLINIYEPFTCKQLIKESTHVTASTSAIVDHISKTYPRNIAEVVLISLSDHFMVFCVRKFEGGC